MKFLEHELAYRLATQAQITRREALQARHQRGGGLGPLARRQPARRELDDEARRVAQPHQRGHRYP